MRAKQFAGSKIQPVNQEHPMGCGVACVAFRCGVSYKKALTFFENPSNAWTRGYYCEEIVAALAVENLRYSYSEFSSSQHAKWIVKPGTIVFQERGPEHPNGHFLVRSSQGWMNPWSNFPQMVPVKSCFQQKIRGKIEFIIFELGSDTGDSED